MSSINSHFNRMPTLFVSCCLKVIKAHRQNWVNKRILYIPRCVTVLRFGSSLTLVLNLNANFALDCIQKHEFRTVDGPMSLAERLRFPRSLGVSYIGFSQLIDSVYFFPPLLSLATLSIIIGKLKGRIFVLNIQKLMNLVQFSN